MQKYFKEHSSKEAADLHIKKIKERGGIVKQSNKGNKIFLEYYFPSGDLYADGGSLNEEIEQLQNQKNDLLRQAEEKEKKYKKLYSKVDITTPMSKEEKQLKSEIANLFSEINGIVIKIRNLRKK